MSGRRPELEAVPAPPQPSRGAVGPRRRPGGKRLLAALPVALALLLAVVFGLRARHGAGSGPIAGSAGGPVLSIVEGKPGSPYPYVPATVRVPAGRAFSVKLTDNLGGCGLETIFEGLGRGGGSASLVVPVGQTRTITLLAPKRGRYVFHCASNMYFGKIVAS